MSQKIGFWSVFAIVTGSQIGSSIFMSPISLAPYGKFSMLGWIISGLGAIALCSVFAMLCAKFPQTGGPHVYVKQAFNSVTAFFTGWTYWVISWVSTTAVIITIAGYLSPFMPSDSKLLYILVELLVLLIVTLINLRGVNFAGNAESLLTLLKFIPLIILPVVALFYFDANNMVVSEKVAVLPTSQILGQVALFTLWGFIGLETGTAPAGSVINPSKTIPRAIILGTSCVALLYILNSVSILGLIPAEQLANSKAPYVDASQILFKGSWHLLISVIAAIVCIGTLNAWVLTSGQIMLGLAKDGFVPKIFKKTNRAGAPFVGIILSSIGIVPLLLLNARDNFAQSINGIIDISVTSFLFVYLVCSIGFLKLMIKDKKFNPLLFLVGLIAAAFCSWVIYETKIQTLLVASLFSLSGIPLYLFWYRRKV